MCQLATHPGRAHHAEGSTRRALPCKVSIFALYVSPVKHRRWIQRGSTHFQQTLACEHHLRHLPLCSPGIYLTPLPHILC